MDGVRLFAPDEIFRNSNPNKFEVNHSQWNFLCPSTVAKQNLADSWSEQPNHLSFAATLKCSMDLAVKIIQNCFFFHVKILSMHSVAMHCLPLIERRSNRWPQGHPCAYLLLVDYRVPHVLEIPSLYRAISLRRVNSSLELDSKSTLPFVNNRKLVNECMGGWIEGENGYLCYWCFKWQC